MKALTKFQKGEGNVEIMDMNTPELLPGHVIMEVHCCGICGTDIHVYHDTFRNYPPVILGHEFSGKIVDRAADVKDVKVDDTFSVLGAVAVTCGQCSYCYRGEFMFCKNRRGMGHGVNGAFTRYVCVRPDQLFKIPRALSMDGAALVEPLAAAMHAVGDIAKIKPGDVVLVSGPGPIGLLCVKLLAMLGVKIIVAGTSGDKFRLDLATQFGAEKIIKVDLENMAELIAEETSGTGVDVAIECAGAESSVRNCLASLRPLGQFIQVGHFGKDLNLPWDFIAFKQLQVYGSVGYTRETWTQTMKTLGQGKLKVEDMITHRFPLSKWKEGFDLCENRQSAKVLLYPD
ncbi:MAG: alcohol dehydrogenase catalytic domain-containing protein [Chitinophagaceae bacterium]|nr:alcohol dehydrogenase catalytic domain-containing protein [Chitinophagaceae bacterium]